MSIDTAGYWCGEDEGHRCGYCRKDTTSISTGLYLSFTSPHRYNALIDRGWRRSGMYMYKPSMDKTCCPQYTIKCHALSFKMSKSQKSVLKTFIEFLENSEIGTLPSKKQKFRNDLLHSDSHHLLHSEIDHSNAIPDGVQVQNSKLPSHGENDRTSSTANNSAQDRFKPANQSLQTTTVVSFKTGLQLANSKKKRDFRRLRKLKKIAAANNTNWEEMDVRALGVQPEPPSLPERLSKALNNKRLELKLVRVDSNTEDSLYNQTFTESHRVYQKYQIAVHKDTADECDERHFRRFLCQPPFSDGFEEEFGAFHHHYYIDGKLAAVGVLDILPWCISSVYFYYDPDYADLSFGTLSALFEIQLTQQLHARYPNIEWYYMGFYIHTCPKMKYKSKFSPSFLLCPKACTWWPIADCQKQLDQNKFCIFDKSYTGEAEPTEDELGTLKVLLDRRLCMYRIYKTLQEVDSYREILILLVKLTGLENAQNIAVYH